MEHDPALPQPGAADSTADSTADSRLAPKPSSEAPAVAEADAERVSAPAPTPTSKPAMQPIPAPVTPSGLDTGYTAAGVPTLEGVREKIEKRYATALGSVELAEETPEGRGVAEQFEARKKAAAAKLDEIRAAMNDPGHDPGQAPQQ